MRSASRRSRVPAPGASFARGAFFLAIVGLALAPLTAEAQQVELRYQYEEGAELRYEMVSTSTTGMPGMGDVRQEQRQVIRMNVLSVDGEGNARIRHTVESIRLDMVTPMGTQSYDSESGNAPTDPAMAPLAAMAGISSEVVIRPDGSLVDAGDLQSWIEQMLQGLDAEARAQVEGLLDAEALEGMMEQSFQALPPSRMAVGDTWEQSFSMPMPFGTLSAALVHTLDAVETREGREVALFTMTGTLGDFEPEPGNPMAGMLGIGGGDLSGRMEFDLTSGMLLVSESTTTLRMDAMGQMIETRNTATMRLLR